ncbi:DUF6397 family protein [Streptomyces sp. NPDC006288]|uniref:DUF6397 family protein n=1 Tax=Streptomyces sp. NPDC006288 TaxID=3156743 RepID=UPI0033BE0617
MTVKEVARTPAVDQARQVSVSAAGAAGELDLKRGEFDLAVHLGLIAMDAAVGSTRPRVARREIERLRALPGFPASLRDRVRTAGTAECATLLGVSPLRFTGLARVGCVSPVAFHLNRYRAVVWLYLVEELLAFAAREPDLVSGGSPAGMRTMLEAGTDWRARNWRSRRIDRALKRTKDPWARAALQASALDPVQIAELVDDPYERAHLARMQQSPVFGRPGSVSGREVMARLMLADDPDEILWRRVNLISELDMAREISSAPRPGRDLVPRPVPVPAARPGPGAGPGAGLVTGRTALGAAPGATRPQSEGAGPALGRPGPRSGGGRRLLARIGLGRPERKGP